MVFWQTAMRPEQQLSAFFCGFVGGVSAKQLLCLGQYAADQIFLGIVQLNHIRLQYIELVIIAFGGWPADYERRTGIVDKHRVHLVHNGVMMFALHEFIRIAGHIVAQVVEAEFAVCAISDIGQIGIATCSRIWFVLVDAIYG